MDTNDTAAVDPQQAFRALMSRFATGVAVIGTAGPRGPHGMTVNSLTSVSLQPLLLLFCAHRGTVTRALVEQTKSFSVNILAHDQEHLSRAFAGQRDLCGHVEWAHLDGVPVLTDAEVVFSCELYNEHSAGDHTIVVGKVTAMRGRNPSRAPLIFYHGHYDSLAGPKVGRSDGV